MKILFVFPNCGVGIAFHPAIQMLSAIAKGLGHETNLLHLHEKFGFSIEKPTEMLVDSMQYVANFEPDIIAFTCTDFEWRWVEPLARGLKKSCPDVFFLIGGKSVRLGKDLDIFDALCFGEGEVPWMDFLTMFRTPEMYNIESMWFKRTCWCENPGQNHGLVNNCDKCHCWPCSCDKPKIIKNKLGGLIENMDELPMLDFEVFDTPAILDFRKKWLSMTFTRGCPYNCTYCYVTADKVTLFDKNVNPESYGMDKYLRKMSPRRVIDEVKAIVEKYHDSIDVINWDDELPVLYHDWICEIADLWKKEIYEPYGIEYCLNGRINVMTERIVKALAESGCREIRMGFESGSFRVRKEVLHKPITNQNMEDVYKMCDKYSLPTTSFTMIGMPTETEDEVIESITMTAKLRPNLIRLSFCYPFENTPLFNMAKKLSIIDMSKYMQQSGYFEESILKWSPEYDQKLMAYRFLFPWYVNCILCPTEKYLYEAKIEEYKDKDLRNPNVLSEIIEVDRQLSETLGDKEHFCYFAGNTNYFHCKNKKYEKVRPIVKKKSKAELSTEVDASGYEIQWVGDEKGYFLIRFDSEKQLLEIGHCNNNEISKVDWTIRGKEPGEIYKKIIDLGLVSRLEHASYLAKELSRAYVAMRLGKKYIQDDPWEDII